MRFDVSLDIEYMVSGNSMPIEGISLSKNLSREGMQLILDKNLLPGTELEFKLRIPGDAAPIYAKGAIVWTGKGKKKEPSIGIRFSHISAFDRNRILEYVYNEWVEKTIGEKSR